MTNKSNKGVSMVEVLIALAIFMIMLIPIVSALSVGTKSTSSAKETQNRNEYVQNLMEAVKEAPLPDVNKDMTATNLDTTDLTNTVKNIMGEIDVLTTGTIDRSTGVETYMITGKTELGTADTTYSYAIEISNAGYAAIPEAGGFKNPNKVTSGIVEDLDQTEVALISAPLSNYDNPAYEALLTKKLSELQTTYESSNLDFNVVADNNYDSVFDADDVNRTIRIIVEEEKNAAGKPAGFNVKCELEYSEDAPTAANREVLKYTPYTRYFKGGDRIPNIYLMYNPCVYNERYAETDTIEFQLKDFSTESLAKNVNVMVVGTASSYRKAGTSSRNNLTVNMTGAQEDIKYIKVYHNLGELYNVNDATVADVINVVATEGVNNGGFKDIGTLNEAQDSRRMYNIKIWMSEGDAAVDTSNDKSLVLQGTRGGDKVEEIKKD